MLTNDKMVLNNFMLTFLLFFQSVEIIFAAIEKDADICIIGGGIAGLSAADTLIANGFTNVQIYESNTKVGGRMAPTQWYNSDGSLSMDMGSPPGIALSSPLYTLAKSLNLLAPQALVKQLATKKPSYYTETGCLIPSDLATLLETMGNTVATSVNTLAAVVGTVDSVGTLYDQAFDIFLKANPTINPPVSNFFKAMLNFRKKAFAVQNGALDLSKVSPQQINLYKDDPPVQMLNQFGMQGILDYFTNRIKKDNIHLNRKLKRISYRDDSPVNLSFTDNKTEDCDIVICTVSLGVLKKNSFTLFDPPLPEDKMNVINNLGCDPTDTFVAVFDKPFWQKTVSSINLLRVGKDDPWMCNYVFNYNETNLSRTFTDLMVHPYQTNALHGHIGQGMDSAYFELSPSHVIMQTISDCLKKFTNNKRVPVPKWLIRTNTGSDPNILCTGSYYTTQCDLPEVECDRSILEEPITVSVDFVDTPIIYFAGEHTDPTGFGKMSGAFMAGVRIAKAIIAS